MSGSTLHEDDGGELSHEDLPFIFERFYRGRRSRSAATGRRRNRPGHCRGNKFEAHGGRVGAELIGEQGPGLVRTVHRSGRPARLTPPFPSYPPVENLYTIFTISLHSLLTGRLLLRAPKPRGPGLHAMRTRAQPAHGELFL